MSGFMAKMPGLPQRSPRPSSWNKGDLLLMEAEECAEGRGRKGKKKGEGDRKRGEERDGKGREEEGREPPYQC